MSLEDDLKAELNTLKTRATLKARVAIAVMLIALAAFGISAWVASKAYRAAADASSRATTAESLVADAMSRAKVLEKGAATAHSEAERWKQEAATTRAAMDAHPRPAPVPAAPPDEPTLTHELGQLLKDPPKLRMDAVTVWDWHQEALRVPGLELRLGDSETLTQAQDKQIGALEQEVDLRMKASMDYRTAVNAEQVRAEALQGQVKAMQTELKAERWKKWLLVGGAAAAGIFAGRK